MNAPEFLQRFPTASRSTVAYADYFNQIKHENSSDPQIQDTKQREQTAALGGGSEREAHSASRPHVCFVLCRTRLLDCEAKYASVKDLLDGLRYAGLIRGDREDQITGEVRQEKVKHRADEKTVIEIVYPDNPLP